MADLGNAAGVQDQQMKGVDGGGAIYVIQQPRPTSGSMLIIPVSSGGMRG